MLRALSLRSPPLVRAVSVSSRPHRPLPLRRFCSTVAAPSLDMERCKALHFEGRLTEAETCYSKLLENHRTKLGDQHVDTLRVMGNFSMLYLRMGKLDDAEDLCREAINGFMKQSANDRYTLAAMSNLAGILSAKKLFSEAEGLYVAVLKNQTQSLGEFHTDTLLTAASLARTIASQGQLDRALEMLRPCLAKHQKALGNIHPDTMSLAEDVYFVLYELGKHEEAEEMLRISLEQRKAELGESHKVTLEAASDLGAFLHMQGKVEEAEALLVDALSKQREEVGEMESSTMATMNRLGALYLSRRNLVEAEKYLVEAHECQTMSLGEDHPETLNTLRKVAILRSDQKQFSEAERLYRDLYAMNLKLYGELEYTALLSLKDLIECLNSAGNWMIPIFFITLVREKVRSDRAQ